MLALKFTPKGNTIGLGFTKEVTSRLNVEKGDIVYLTESPEGYKLTPYNPEFEAQMKVAEKVMKKRRNALRELAK